MRPARCQTCGRSQALLFDNPLNFSIIALTDRKPWQQRDKGVLLVIDRELSEDMAVLIKAILWGTGIGLVLIASLILGAGVLVETMWGLPQ